MEERGNKKDIHEAAVKDYKVKIVFSKLLDLL